MQCGSIMLFVLGQEMSTLPSVLPSFSFQIFDFVQTFICSSTVRVILLRTSSGGRNCSRQLAHWNSSLLWIRSAGNWAWWENVLQTHFNWTVGEWHLSTGVQNYCNGCPAKTSSDVCHTAANNRSGALFAQEESPETQLDVSWSRESREVDINSDHSSDHHCCRFHCVPHPWNNLSHPEDHDRNSGNMWPLLRVLHADCRLAVAAQLRTELLHLLSKHSVIQTQTSQIVQQLLRTEWGGTDPKFIWHIYCRFQNKFDEQVSTRNRLDL